MLVMTGIQRYYIEEVDIVVEDEKGVAVEQAVVEMLGVEALLSLSVDEIWSEKERFSAIFALMKKFGMML